MIRLQVEAHVGAITNLEAAKQAGYEVAIQSREARPGYPIHLVGERIFNASDGKLDEKFCVAANETYSHRDGTFGIEEAHVIGDLLKKYFVDAKLARRILDTTGCTLDVLITQVMGQGPYTVDKVIVYKISPKQPKGFHVLTQKVISVPTLGLEG